MSKKAIAKFCNKKFQTTRTFHKISKKAITWFVERKRQSTGKLLLIFRKAMNEVCYCIKPVRVSMSFWRIPITYSSVTRVPLKCSITPMLSQTRCNPWTASSTQKQDRVSSKRTLWRQNGWNLYRQTTDNPWRSQSIGGSALLETWGNPSERRLYKTILAFSIEGNIAVIVLLPSTFIDRFVKSISSPWQKISRYNSEPVPFLAIIDGYSNLTVKKKTLEQRLHPTHVPTGTSTAQTRRWQRT